MYFNQQNAILDSELVNRHPLLEGKKLWWMVLPGQDGGRTWYDLMGRYNGTLTNTTAAGSGWQWSTRRGSYGEMRITGTGTGDRVLGPTPLVAADYTWAMWHKSGRLVSTNACIPLRCSLTAAGFDFHWGNATVANQRAFIHYNSAGTAVVCKTVTALTASVWYHLVGTWDGSNIRIYVDGQLERTVATASMRAPTGNFCIGDVSTTAVRTIGQFDDIGLWQRCLTAEEVFQLYESSIMGHPDILRRNTAASFAGAMFCRKR